jgi:hypothetical protein
MNRLFQGIACLLILGSLCLISLAIVRFVTYGPNAPTPDWSEPIIFIAISSVLLSPIAGRWFRRASGVAWLEKEWRELTGARRLPADSTQVFGALKSLVATPEKFHRARDIAAWLGYCDPQLRPRDLAKTE